MHPILAKFKTDLVRMRADQEFPMTGRVLLVAASLALLAGCTPTRDFHGYIVDEAAPADVEPGVDTRTSVLARLGSPSTKSIFDDNTWVYMSSPRDRLAYFRPKVSQRSVVAIRFTDENVVDEVLTYDADDGEVISYAARETATRGRELGVLEQLFGNVGRVVLPPTDERTPGNPTGRQ